jgi:hypothetical protein
MRRPEKKAYGIGLLSQGRNYRIIFEYLFLFVTSHKKKILARALTKNITSNHLE